MTTTTSTDTAQQLDDLTAKLEAATTATADTREELAAAQAARGDANATGTLTDAHSTRVLAARQRLEVCLETEHALTRRRRALLDEALPAAFSEAGDSRTVRVTVVGRPGQWSCTHPTTGRKLMGGDELAMAADDALSFGRAGHVRVIGKAPSWWPNSVPIPDASLHRDASAH